MMMAEAKLTLASRANEDLKTRVQLYLSAQRPEFQKLLVGADHGTVELSGQASSFYLRQLAVSAASRVAGVRHIVDGINVPGPGR